jgi:tetratricopeptide (TPR) repeat protein
MTETDSSEQAIQRARALCELGRFDEAAAMARRAASVNPDDADTWCLLAQALIGLDDDHAALDAARKATALAPEDEWPHRLRSIALRSLNRYDEALAAAQRSVQAGPYSWQAHSQHAVALALVGEREAAEAAATKTLALAPNHAHAWTITGDVARIIGDRDVAAERYRNALRLDPQDADAHGGLARLQVVKGGPNAAGLADAASGFARAVRTDPRDQRFRDGVDASLRVFLARAAYFFCVVCYIGLRTSSGSSSPAARWVPVVLLVAPGLFVGRFLARLDGVVRARLFSQLRRGLIGCAAAADVGAALVILAGAVMPRSARPDALGIAVFLAVIGRIVSYVERRRAMPHMFEATVRSRVVGIALAVGLAAAGVLLVVAGGPGDNWRVTGVGVAVLVVAAAMAVPLVRGRRRR